MVNQRGFILPITLFIVFLLSSYVTFQISQYKVEKELFYEQSELYTAERLIKLAIVDVRDIIQQSNSSSYSGKLYYNNGEVTYVINQIAANMKSITLVSQTLQQRKKRYKFYYNLNEETVSP